MKTDDFDYDLPKDLIAQTPLKNRNQSRMMVLDKLTGKYEDNNFKNLIAVNFTYYFTKGKGHNQGSKRLRNKDSFHPLGE